MRLRNPAVHDGMHQRWNVSLLWSLVLDLADAHAGKLGVREIPTPDNARIDSRRL